MSPDKEKELINIYPDLFTEVDPKYPFQLFGFECGDGWFDLLKECIEGIKGICQRDNLVTKVHQVKEKYADLRFYLSTYTDALSEVIEKAERKSSETCEICGQPGKREEVRAHWWQTLCKTCLTKE